MRALMLVAVAGLAATPVLAQEIPPPGVVQVDSPAMRQHILDDQVACHKGAVAQGRTDSYVVGVPPNALAAVISLSLAGVIDGMAATSKLNQRMNACMAERGYTPINATAEDEARFQTVRAGGTAVDPWATIIRYTPGPSRGTTMREQTDTTGAVTRTYTVGRC